MKRGPNGERPGYQPSEVAHRLLRAQLQFSVPCGNRGGTSCPMKARRDTLPDAMTFAVLRSYLGIALGLVVGLMLVGFSIYLLVAGA